MMMVIQVYLVVVSGSSLEFDGRGIKENTLYIIHTKVCNRYVNALRDDSLIELWHKRIENMNDKVLQILSKREAILG